MAQESENSGLRLRYEGKVSIVTGGAAGIGEGCVRVFVRHGSKVVICDKQVEAGKALEADVNSQGPGEAYFVQCDVTEENQIQHVIKETVKKYGRIDCLINNVGWHPPPKTIDEFSVTEFRDLFDLNVVSCFAACKYALPYLRQTQGCIVNTSSVVGMIGQAYSVTYVATKGAISAMTRALAVDEAKYGVRVNAFSPSNIWTPLWEGIAADSANPEVTKQAGADAQLLGRFGTMEECGQMCLFLASEATFCTGQDIPLSGGAELNYGKKTMIKSNDTLFGSWK